LKAAAPTAIAFATPVGNPQPFKTPPSASGNQNGSSTTTGLNGTLQKFDDGSTVIEATENLTARRTGGFSASLTASCRRVQQGDTTIVHQVNYSYKQRALPDSTAVTGVTGLSLAVPGGFQSTAVKQVKATQFGKNDHQDEGTGTPDMGLIQTNSDVFGGSVRISVMKEIFGANWRTNSKRLGAMIDIFFAAKKRMVRVPLVDVGPGENAPSHAEVDLTLASDQFLGTSGLATVQYRYSFRRDGNCAAFGIVNGRRSRPGPGKAFAGGSDHANALLWSFA
jgi:hypothetical protein